MGVRINNYQFYIKIGLLPILFIISSCTSIQSHADEKMYALASALTKLSTAVESTVRYKNPPQDITDHELLVLATKHETSLLQPFTGYAMIIKKENRHAIVLMCEKDKSQALLEDAGCSAEMDIHHWKAKEKRSCSFTLNIVSSCSIIKGDGGIKK